MPKNCLIQPYTKFNSSLEWEEIFKYLTDVKNSTAIHVKPNLRDTETTTKTAYFVKTIFDKPNGFVDIEFVVAGYEKTEINVEFSHKEKTLFVRNSQNETLCTYLFDDNLTQDVDFSQNPTSTLKNGILKVSFKLKQEQKDIKITIN